MAIAAVISVERTIKELINSPRISLSPPCIQMMEFAYQQLKSCQEILERLDGSSKAYCRKKVNGVDARIKEAVWEFQDLIESHVSNQILSQSDQILPNTSSDTSLAKLLTLVGVSARTCTREVLERIPNLRKLGV